MANADWWNKQLGVQPAQQQAQQPRATNMPSPPSQQPMTPFVAPQPQAPASKAKSATQTELCPNCSGNNYMSPAPNIALRCYDCGYPLEQSGSRYGSLAGAKVEGNVKTSIGNDVQSNWNPQGIIGRVDG